MARNNDRLSFPFNISERVTNSFRFVSLVYEFKPDPSRTRLCFPRGRVGVGGVGTRGGGRGEEASPRIYTCAYIYRPTPYPSAKEATREHVLFSDNFTVPSKAGFTRPGEHKSHVTYMLIVIFYSTRYNIRVILQLYCWVDNYN